MVKDKLMFTISIFYRANSWINMNLPYFEEKVNAIKINT